MTAAPGPGATPERLLELGEAALALDGVDDAEALVWYHAAALTRFASSRIHQSTWSEDVEVRVRVALDGNRVGVASAHGAGVEAARAAASRAREVARAMPPDPGYPGMPGAAAYPAAAHVDEATAAADPATRAGLVAGVVAALPPGVEAAGACETGMLAAAVANTNGVRVAAAVSGASFSVLADAGSGTGWAEAIAPSLAGLDAAALGERAAAKAVASREPLELPPGSYPVVLEPVATATLVAFLGYLGFGAKAYDEGRSFLCGRLGEPVCSPLVTVVDDALAPGMIGLPFDFEGVPRRRVTLVDRGVAASLVYDWRSALRHGVAPTGHGLPAPSPEGAMPLHLALEPGGTPTAELVAGLERGLVVTRLHYTNVIDPLATTITGMTRDGTFLVEDGAVRGGVRNLRFTQSILAALDQVTAVGAEAELVGELASGAVRAPALAIARFNFSS